jgi:hypothetical protein
MKRFVRVSSILILAGASAGLVACGGNGDNSAQNGDAGGDASTDGTGGDDGAGGGDGSGGNDSGGMDTGGGDTGGGDAGCAGLGTAKACRACCVMTYPAGYKALIDAELACGCADTLCGPPDGGGAGDGGAGDAGGDAGDAGGDGGVVGPGSCTANMCDKKAKTDPQCLACLASVTGTMKNPKHCYMSVAAACMASADCTSFVGCEATCP